MTRAIVLHSCALLLAVGCAHATGARGPAHATSSAIDAVVIHPPMATAFTCSEHPLGSEDHAGDALGSDCLAYRNDGGPSGKAMRFHTGDGTRNEDWFSWNESLLAPFDGIVRLVYENPVTNRPGARGPDPASAILFQRLGDPADAPVQVAYVHVRDIRVKIGDSVRTGQVVARIGNNGNAMYPHVHVGAMRGDLARVLKREIPDKDVAPLQIRFDLAAMGRLRGYVR